MTTVSGVDPYAAINGTNTKQTKNEADAADRFLKLLVTQMQNQDPLNPMDNAQVTSQMAQINTVSGIDKLNTTVNGLNSQFLQMQTLQGAALVGRDVTLAGNRIDMRNGVGAGGIALGGTADNVKVEVLNGGGHVVDTLDLGSLSQGRHAFEWTPKAGVANDGEYTFRVTATKGAAAVSNVPLMRDRVSAVSSQGSTVTLETSASGYVAYSDIVAFN